ncbi:MAG TPA: DPP IV N-terminal domain-containing protein [Bacteroidales bacterium]|nr:DPP IV N-terminal domain-containing protein [Bacteroidales bacterium]
MKNYLLIPSIILCFAILSNRSFSQSQRRVIITGWIDNNHFSVRIPDDKNRIINKSVDVLSGESVEISPSKPARESLFLSISDGFSPADITDVSADQQSALLTRDNDIYLFSQGKEIKKLTNDSIPEVNTRFSPDGSKIAYTKNKDMYVFDIINNKEIRLTFDASTRIYNGYSSWVYMEEILGRSSKYAAFWWSPDGKKIAFLRTDESDVPDFIIRSLDEKDGVHGTTEITPYPKPGDPNPKVKMGIADVTTTETTWVKTDYSVDQYFAWPFWTPDSRKLAIQQINRDQNVLKIILADVTTGNYSTMYEEKTDTWVDFKEDIEVLNDGSGIILMSNESGWKNLYHIGWEGKRFRLTTLDFDVTSIDRIDEEKRIVYFSATGSEPTDDHSFRVDFDGKNLFMMTKGEGTHNVSISPGGDYYIDTWSSFTDPGSIVLYERKGKQIRQIYDFEKTEDAPRRELIKITTSDGLFRMPATIIYPHDFDMSKKYAVVFTVYGGPGSKNISNRWSDNISWFAQNGIIEFSVDHRGSGQFGKKGTDYLYRNLGKWELLDYQDAVKWLRSKSWIDSLRIGITGSSYGGYLTCLALTKGAGYWTHGFASSSVTDWKLYDDIYTERYMDTPQNNPDGYKNGSALTFTPNYIGKLYLTHGDIDDNVHLQNTIQLISQLQDLGKAFEFMLYPGMRHGMQRTKAIHLMNEENKFWLRSFFDN